jgi:hypothetical protein
MKTKKPSEAEDLWRLVRGQKPELVLNALYDKNLTEEMAIFMAKGKNTPAETLGILAGDVRFKDSYALKLAIAKNPKTPRKVSLRLLKFLRIFDLAEMTKDHLLAVTLRQKIEHSIMEKIPSMASGIKSALAKRANSSIIVKLMEKGDVNVITSCLESPALTEGHIYGLINKTTKPLLIRMIAEHRKWSLRYSIRFALVRNFYTPMPHVARFIRGLKTQDLKFLYSDPKLPSSTRPFIYRELLERAETVETPKEETYVLDEDEEDNGNSLFGNDMG